MTYDIASFSFTYHQFIMLAIAAALIGMGKTGVQGAGMIAIPLLALVFGGKASTGIILPLLIFADLFAVYYYHQHASWQHLRKLIPFTLIGIILGTIAGNLIDDLVFGQTMAVIIFACLGLMIWRERTAVVQVPDSMWIVATIGIIGGLTTMVGNLAGPVMALYLLSMRLPKDQFIGTAAWFFLLVNLLKVPLHIWVWETIRLDTFVLNLYLLPVIAVGSLLGVILVKKLHETAYRWFVIVMTAVAALAMLL